LVVGTRSTPRGPAMHLKTLLNKVHPVKGFVYTKERLVPDARARNGVRLEVWLRARKGSRGICSVCGSKGPTYDRQGERRFDFVPLWGIAVALIYALRRIDCRRCGVKVERVPWSQPGSKSPMTRALAVFLAGWAKRLSWQEVAQAFSVSWESVYRAVEWMVKFGLDHRDLSKIEAIGVDEVAWVKGAKYATLVYQIEAGCKRLLYIGRGRSVRSLLGFFRMLKKAKVEYAGMIRFVCSDMWAAYLKVLAKKVPQAVHILDRYHIVSTLSKALDQIRAEESRKLAKKGWDVLKHSRWLLLRRRKRLNGKQRYRLRQILQHNLRTVRAYLLAEGLQALWEYRSPTHAGRFLDAWCGQAMRSRLEPIQRVARSLRRHRELILNWFRAKKRYNSGIVEGLNTVVKLRCRKAYGFRTFEALQTALYHQLGHLPEPPVTHRFC
jgi:transposase